MATATRGLVKRRAQVRPGRVVIDRATATDLAFLAMDTPTMPEQFGVILVLDEADDLDLQRVRNLLAERMPAIPRLRQRLVRTPFGCGGPVWVDDAGFDICRQVRSVVCADPGDESALLDTALSMIATPLPRTAPLWSAVLVTGLVDGRVGLVVVLHHVLADGIGGLDVLANLVDQETRPPGLPFPRSRPTAGELAVDAWAGRLRALGHGRRSWRLLRRSTAAGGGLRPQRATPCSLIQQTGPRRTLAVIRADLATLRAAAHRHGATTNDAVLVAVAGALHRTLLARREYVDTISIAVPVSGRADGGPALGNNVAPMLVRVPATGAVDQRLGQVAAWVRAHKAAATGPPPIAILGWLFRPLAALGGFRWYMNHQHRMHTLVSHVRGPRELMMFGGCPVISATPVGLGEGGNMTTCFEVLSYAGTLSLTVIVDQDHVRDLDALTDRLRTELDLITDTCPTTTSSEPGSGG